MDLFSFLDDCDQESPTVSQDAAHIGPLEQDFLSDRKRKNSDCDGEATISQKTEAREYTRPGIATSKRSKLELKLIVLDESNRDLTQSLSSLPAELELRHRIRHQVVIPSEYGYVPMSRHVPPSTPAREYTFTLDPFQQVSIHAIQRNESVLVSAHTSAGKTVVAEYTIAQCLQNKQRVIYTSPIKALSNQKYRDLLAIFGDVGLMTGDVTINSSASCLVMTTEILRSMLYKGSEIIREVAWIVFDEIHYMRDKDRGVVWEETIILLPHAVRYVFLSATIPNAVDFAGWVCKLHEQPCHVVYTDFRPTPLQHHLFPSGSPGIYLIVNEKADFKDDNFFKAMAVLQDSHQETSSMKKNKGTKVETNASHTDLEKLVRTIHRSNLLPAIVFAFSKRECETLALSLSRYELNSVEEQENVTMIFNNAMATLSADEHQLPQIHNLLPLLKRGVGIHHGGLLPILKEVTEIVFQAGYIKLLFATETFSIGLNMPAKTVVFTSVKKFDGREFRYLSSGEYIQMSGRAGRRGLDDRGVVILMCDKKLEPEALKGIVKGESDPLDSAFHLGYNMILNLMRLEGISPEFILGNSFFQYQKASAIPSLEIEVKETEDFAQAISIPDEDVVVDYYLCRQHLESLSSQFKTIITHPSHSLPFLQTGRLVKVKHQTTDFGWGVILGYRKTNIIRSDANTQKQLSPHEEYIVDTLLHCAANYDPSRRNITPDTVRPCEAGRQGETLIVPITLLDVESLSQLRVTIPKDLRSSQSRETAWKTISEVQRRMPDGIPLLDPIESMNITDSEFVELVEKIGLMEKKLFANLLHNDPRLPQLYADYSKKVSYQERARELKKVIRSTENILQMEELKSRTRVLRRLGFVTAEGIVDVKGRVACEISTGDELLLTELIFNDGFGSLAPEYCAALLSCFVFSEKSEKTMRLSEQLAAPLRRMQELARRIAQVSLEAKLPIVEAEYVQSFKLELMEAVVAWCRGASFSDVCKLTDQFEGNLIRVFRRLLELIRQMSAAAKVIGNMELQEKFEKAAEMLERPNSVIFSSSLHL